MSPADGGQEALDLALDLVLDLRNQEEDGWDRVGAEGDAAGQIYRLPA
jgi:hypothetical protein